LCNPASISFKDTLFSSIYVYIELLSLIQLLFQSNKHHFHQYVVYTEEILCSNPASISIKHASLSSMCIY